MKNGKVLGFDGFLFEFWKLLKIKKYFYLFCNKIYFENRLKEWDFVILKKGNLIILDNYRGIFFS